jgi:O-antigen/teichoic acid export membrane protein
LSVLKKNIAANFVGSIWQSLIGLALIPLYIKFMGIESWGLIGLYVSLQAIFGLLDLGLSNTLNREMARLSVLPNKEQQMRNLLRTLEMVYWGIAVFVGIIAMSLSTLIANYWIKAEGGLPLKTIEQSIFIMGLVIALRMPIGLYSGGFMGLQKHVLLNMINVAVTTLGGFGTVLILWLVVPTIQTFFLCQTVVCIINVLLLALFLWAKLPLGDTKAVFQRQLFKGLWKFAAGMSGISIFAVILTQLDKVILIKMVTLEMFGYYTLATAVRISLNRLIAPLFVSIYPRLTQLASIDDHEELKRLYHKSCQFMSVLILPIATVIAFFSYEILFLWTRNQVIAENTHLLVSILICGTAFNGLMHLPFALQLAFGWTSLSIFKNVIALILLVPFIIYMTKHYGATGAALTWLFLNMGYIFLEIPIMHRRILRKEKWRWYLQDVCLPIMSCILVTGLGRICMNKSMSEFMTSFYIIIVSVLTFMATVITIPIYRTWLFERLVKIKVLLQK